MSLSDTCQTCDTMAGGAAVEAAVAALPNAAVLAALAAGAVPGPPANAGKPSPQKRPRAPKIDIDAAIAAYQQEVKKAAKLMAEARKSARNEKRKKQRLMKKASSLSTDDLERIATLKRVGLWNPGLGAPADPASDVVPEAADGEAAPGTPIAAPPRAGNPSDGAAAAAAGPSDDEEGFEAPAAAE